MKDFITKIDDDATDAGVVVADEYNSIFRENKNAVKTFLALNGADEKQLQKAVDIATKALFYTDAGTPNSVILSRSATTETTETLFDGMIMFFTPANANTGATTLKVTTLVAKDLYYNGAVLPAGFLATNSRYIAIYSVSNERFDVDLIVNYKNLQDIIIDTRLNTADEDYAGQSAGVEILKDNGANIKNQCTAWVYFDGTTTPPTIKDSFNVADIVRTATGIYEIYFESDMDNVNYAVNGNSGTSATGADIATCDIRDVTKVRCITRTNTGVNTNTFFCDIQVFGGKV